MVERARKGTNPLRRRTSTPRSKNGCGTCKIRRLKCGEEKPSCHRCLKSGWHCDGYEHVTGLPPIVTKIQIKSRARISSVSPSSSPSCASSPSCISISPSICTLPLDTQFCEQEGRYFKSFIDDVSPHFENLDASFWQAAVRHSSYSNSIRHGIIAIGALAQSAKWSDCGHYRMDIAQGFHREFALQQYQKAIQGLRKMISSIDNSNCVRATLVCCLVLSCFDNFIGNGGFALQHITYARNLLASSKPLNIPPLGLNIEDEESLISTIFYRLDLQALFTMGADESRTYISFKQHCRMVPLPTSLSSLEQARNLRDLLVWEGQRFLYQNSFYQFVPKSSIPSEAYEVRDHLIEQLHTLHSLLDEFLLDSELDSQYHPFLRPEGLKIYSTNLLIRLTMSLQGPRVTPDALLPHFVYLLYMAAQTLEFEAGRNSTVSESEIFTFEVRTSSLLFLIASKCREATIRRRAIDLLLSYHRRECMYDSLLAGQVGEWMMKLEEAGMDEIGYIPEEARTWGECIELDLQRKKAKVKCRLNVREGGWKLKQKDISW